MYGDWRFSHDWKKALATNSTASAFTAKGSTLTRPANDGVHTLCQDGGNFGPNQIKVQPYILGDDNDVMAMRVWGWSPLGDGSKAQWVSAKLCEVVCTATGTYTGVAGGLIVATELFCDTLAITDGNALHVLVESPEDDTPGFFTVRTQGARLIEFDFDRTTGDPTSVNALWSQI